MTKYKLNTMLITAGSVLLIMAVFSLSIYVYVMKMLEERVFINARGLAYSLSRSMELDIDKYKNFKDSLDTESDYYRTMNMLFSDINAAFRSGYVFTACKEGENTVVYYLTGGSDGTQSYIEPGTVSEMNDLERKIYDAYESTHSSGEISEYTDRVFSELMGNIIISYSPLIDRETGEFLGFVGVAYIDSIYHSGARNLLFAMITVSAIMVSLSLFVAFLIKSKIANPLMYDHTTQLLNKRNFEMDLQKKKKKALKEKKNIVILIADLDCFKQVNDTYGHLFGDLVLLKTARIFKQVLLKNSCIARYGGDEFIASFYDVTPEEVLYMSEEVRRKVEKNEIISDVNNEDGCERKTTITTTIGIAEFKGDTDTDVYHTIQKADAALYEAKNRRNRVILFEDES